MFIYFPISLVGFFEKKGTLFYKLFEIDMNRNRTRIVAMVACFADYTFSENINENKSQVQQWFSTGMGYTRTHNDKHDRNTVVNDC